MKTVNLIYTKSAAADTISPFFDLNDLVRFCIQVDFTGADVAGTLKLEASQDGVSFFDVPDSTQNVTSSAGYLYSVNECGFRYIRVNWDYTSGTGNITANLSAKEPMVKFG